MLRRLPVVLAQVKSGNKLESLLNELKCLFFVSIEKNYQILSNLSQFLIFTVHVKTKKKSCNNNKSKISAPTWNDEIGLADGSYLISDIQDYLEYILKKHNENIDNPSIRIYVNKTENRIKFKIKTGELLSPEIIKLLGSTENKITKNKNGENLTHLEIAEVIPVHCNIVYHDYQQDSTVLYIHLFQIRHLVVY